MISTSIRNAYFKKIEREYGFLCWAIDLHGTIAIPSYDKDEELVEFYPGAVETLKYMSESDAHRLILWTSTHPNKYDMVLDQLSDLGVNFDYINENPEFKSNTLCDFSEKFAFDILLDDKAGFSPECFYWNSVMRCVKTFDRANRILGGELVCVENGMMDSIIKYTLLDIPEKTVMISDGKLHMNGKVIDGSVLELETMIGEEFSGVNYG